MVGRDDLVMLLKHWLRDSPRTSSLGLGCEGWLMLPQLDAPVLDLGNRSDEPPISSATLGRQRAPSGLEQMGGSSDLSLGLILIHLRT